MQPYCKRGLPFIFPARGRLNKNGIGIRSFDIYLDGLQEEYKPLYSATQDTLNVGMWMIFASAEGIMVTKKSD
jgi:hypothetical protein